MATGRRILAEHEQSSHQPIILASQRMLASRSKCCECAPQGDTMSKGVYMAR